ncbi:Asp-tRNA(Asn)/Glu-tRNA(Gln) amidotransferase GatCAB subunit C, partial [Enterococcus hirae]
GVRFVNVSPVADDAPEWLQGDWLVARPGTDVELMLGLAYVLETEDLLDRGFVASHCVGYERFREYLLGSTDGVAKTPAW